MAVKPVVYDETAKTHRPLGTGEKMDGLDASSILSSDAGNLLESGSDGLAYVSGSGISGSGADNLIEVDGRGRLQLTAARLAGWLAGHPQDAAAIAAEIPVVSEDAGNIVSAGSDGGAFLDAEGAASAVESVLSSSGEAGESLAAAVAGVISGSGADLGGARAAASGTDVLRSFSDRFADVANVKDFGAVGDGETDDTAAFAAAAAAAGDASVFVPKGVYSADGVDMSRLSGDGAVLWPTGKQISVRNAGTAEKLCQTYWGEAYSGVNSTVQDCSICRNDVDGKTYLFTCQQVEGTAYTSGVVHVVTQYEMPDEALDAPNVLESYASSQIRPVAQCQLTGKLGHGEGVYAVCRSGQFYLYGQACHQYAQDGTTILRHAKTGFTKTAWRGDSTDETDVQTFYGLTEVGNAGQVCLTPDGRRLIVCYSLDTYSASDDGETYYWDSSAANAVVFYDLEALESAASDSVREGIPALATYVFGRQSGLVVRSGIATDGRYMYVLTSAGSISGDESLGVYSFNGDAVKVVKFCAVGDVVKNAFMDGVSSGGYFYFPYAKEVEGAALFGDTVYAVAKLHFAKLPSSGTSCCTYVGRTYVAVKDSTGKRPTDSEYWVPTRRSIPGAQPWDSAVSYTGLASSDGKLLHYRYIIGISPSGVHAYEWPLDQAVWYRDVYDLSTSGNVLTMVSRNFASAVVGTLSTNFGSSLPYAKFTDKGKLFLYDANKQASQPDLPFLSGYIHYDRGRDATDYLGGTSNYGLTAFMRVGRIDTREDEAGGIAFFTGNSESGSASRRLYIVPDAGTIRVYDDLRPAVDDSSNLGSGALWWKKAFLRELEVYGCIHAGYDTGYYLRPLADGVDTAGTDLGSPSKRWRRVYASDGTINTSDARMKEDVENPSEALLRAWGRVRMVLFRFSASVAGKGDSARVHAGCIAQEIAAAFSAEGLDASRYGFFCYDEWDDVYEDVDVLDQPEVLDARGEVVEPERTHTERRLVTPAGSRYSLRYDEVFALEAAYQRARADAADARVAALEARIAALEARMS